MTTLQTLATTEYKSWHYALTHDERGHAYILYSPQSPQEALTTRLRYETADKAQEKAQGRIDDEIVLDHSGTVSDDEEAIPPTAKTPIRPVRRSRPARVKSEPVTQPKTRAAVAISVGRCSCGGDTCVLETRYAEEATRRRRKCLVCGNRYTTLEMREEVFLAVKSKAGKFDALIGLLTNAIAEEKESTPLC